MKFLCFKVGSKSLYTQRDKKKRSNGGDRLCNKIYFSRSRGKHECSIGVLTQESELVREHLGGPLGNSHILGWA